MRVWPIRAAARALRNVVVPPPPVELAARYPQYQIGRGTYGDLTVQSWGEGSTLKIGNYTSIAAGVKILLGGEHRTDWVTTFPFNVLWRSAQHHLGHPQSKGDVHIGNDVWIGTEAIILSGVNIGDGSVIAARTVVTKDVQPYSIVAGNPARFIKQRFDEVTARRLLALRWWGWNEDQIAFALPDMLSRDIERFLDRGESGFYNQFKSEGGDLRVN